MSSADEVRVSYVADIKDLTAKLKSVSGLTASEVRAQVASVVAGQKAQTAAMEKVAAASATAGARGLKAVGPLGGVLARMSPEAGAVASSISGMTSAVEGFSAAGMLPLAGALAVSVGALAIAYEAATASLEREIAIQKISADGYAAELPMLAKIATTKLDLAHATGAITDEEYRRKKVSAEVSSQLAAATKADVEGITAASEAQAGWTTKIIDWINWLNPLEHAINALTGENFHLGTTTGDLDKIIDAHKASIAAATVAANDLEINENRLAVATQKHGKTAAEVTAEILKQARAEQEAADAFGAKLAAVEKSSAEADQIIRASGDFRLSEIDRLQAAEAKSIADYVEKAKAGAIDAAAGVAQIRANYAEQITAKEREEARTRADAEAAATAASQQAAAGSRDAWLSTASSIVGSFEQLAQSSERTYSTSTAAGRKAAQHQWQAQHAMAVGSTLALAAVAEAQAWASAPFPANIPAVAAATVAGIASVAAAESAKPPAFHAGGLAPDEAMARVLPGEQVVSRQGVSTFDRDGQRANAGVSAGPSMVSVELKLRHSSLDTAMYEVQQRGGRFAGAISASRAVPFGYRGDSWQR